MKHIWECKTPYHCEESGYYYETEGANAVKGWGATQYFDTWGEFVKEWGYCDLDLNLLFRFDWYKETPEQASMGYDMTPMHTNREGMVSELKLWFMMQRKGCKKLVVIRRMEDDNEFAVRDFLRARFEHLKKMWEPVSE